MIYHRNTPSTQALALLLSLPILAAISGCTNAPYPESERNSSVRYTSMGEDPKTLDPSVAYDVDSMGILGNICDTFLQYHYLKRNPVVLIPSMGARMPERNPYLFTEQVVQKNGKGEPVKDAAGAPVKKLTLQHGEIWTFTLKPGIRYADDPCFPGGKGREAAAADFIRSLKRTADPSVPCQILSYLSPHILGLQEFYDVESKKMTEAKGNHQDYVCNLDQPVEGLQVDRMDPYVFRVILRDKYPQFKYLMAMTLTSPIPHEALAYYDGKDHEQFRRHPVGTGPYHLTEWSEKQRLVMERNPYYHGDYYPSEGAPGDREKGLLADAGKPLPLTDKIVRTVIRENISGWNLFQQGYLDSYGVPRESFDRVISRQGSLSPDMVSKGITLETSVGLDISYFAFNMEDALVGGYTPKKRKLRQALSMAFDADEYLELVLNGRGIPAQGVIPPGIFGYDPNYRNPYRQTNLDRAKALLAEAGYRDGIDPATHKPLEIYYDDTSTGASDRQVTGLITRQLERLGIKVTERGYTFAVFQDRVNNGQFQFTSWGWNADYPDPENFFLLLYGPNKGPGPNSARYSNPAFDLLYQKMASMDDGPERKKIINQMRDILQEDCPWIFNFYSMGYSLRYNWETNAKTHPVANNTSKYIAIDYTTRTRKQQEWNSPRYDVVGVLFLAIGVFILPAVLIVRRRRAQSARAARETLISYDGGGSL